MKPEFDWERVKDLFDRASGVAAAGRAAWLAAECGPDEALRREVEALRAAGDAAPDLFEQTAVAVMPELLAASPDGLKPEEMIGPYRLQERIGIGGMGTVWKAFHSSRPQEQVAVKVLWQAAETPDLLRRFANERKSLAALRHPNIARLLDGGLSTQGRPYLVMEFVDGTPIDRWCDERALPISRRLEILRAVCDGVHFAHRNLIVHRDLKPDNVLVTADGTPKLLDFGISKILGDPATDGTVTLTEMRAMTPQYASPEQVRGETVTTASDVYSLGVMLYELLTGRRPYRVPAVLGAEAQRVITQTEPPRPSTVAAREPGTEDTRQAVVGGAVSLAERRGLRPEGLSRALAGDLDKIVLMAMRKDPVRRYASAGHLAEELGRWLHGLPVEAQEDSFGYRLRKFVRRNRLAVTAGVLVFLSLVAGIIGTAWQARIASRSAAYAKSEAQSLHRIVDFLTALYDQAAEDHLSGRQTPAIAVLEESVRTIRMGTGVENVRDRSALLGAMGQTYVMLGRFDEAEQMLQESLAIRQELYPEGHAELAESRYRLALLRSAQGRKDEAENLVREALQSWKEEWGDTVDLGQTQHLLGKLLLERGATSDAEVHLREAERILTTLLASPRSVLMVRNDLAVLLLERGAWSAAEELLQNAVAQAGAAFVHGHLRLAIAERNRAQALIRLGRNEEARELLERLRAEQTPLLQDGHPFFEALRAAEAELAAAGR
jgi:serine/threonine-protein kinase